MLTALLKDIGETAEEMLGFCKDENDCNRVITPLFEVQSELCLLYTSDAADEL